MVGFFTAPAVAWGPGALEQLSGLGARRAAVVVDPGVRGQQGPRRCLEELERAGAVVSSFGGPPVGSDVRAVSDLARELRAVEPDWIVVIGGGTAIDATKAARLLLERPELSLERPPVDPALPERPRTRLVAIPTTSGSGAEASWVCDLLAPDGAPIEVAHRSLVPDWAIIDPRFAEELPAPEVVAGALETVAQACEAYLSAWANPFSDALAIDAVRTVVRRLAHAVRWSDDPDARAALHYAATQAGIAQSNAQRGLAHALARALARASGVGYGRLLGVVLPVVLEFDRPAARERLEALAESVRSPGEPSALTIAERVRRLVTGAGTSVDLTAAARDRARVVADTLRSPGVLANPKVPTAGEVEHLLEALTGAPATGPDPRA